MHIYVITMYRFGNRNKHSYVLGAYLTKKVAKKYARIEEADRGEKYLAEILKIKVDKEYNNVNEMVEIKLGDD